MAQKHYSPALAHDIVRLLYHAAKARRIPMTRLASSLLREGLARLCESDRRKSPAVCEEPQMVDPHLRHD